MKLGLAGKTAVVTGASRGIGLATVRALSAEGVSVLGAARTVTPELSASAKSTMTVDLTDPGAASELVARAAAELGGVDLLVNNVGGGAPEELAGFAKIDDDLWRRVFDLNFFTAVRVSRAALPRLAERRGCIVNVSSIGAWEPTAPPLAYNVAKAALKALGRGLARELAPLGIRVVTVSPGPTRTAMWEAPDGPGAALAATVGIPQAAFLDQVPSMLGMVTGRMATPDEVAALITFLSSELAANVTGSDHLVDGGAVRSA